MKYFKVFALLLKATIILAQFNYELKLNPVNIEGLPGLHSYAFGQSNNMWLIIGGRLDGLHARQPFNSFPESSNNKNILVVDPIQKRFWSRSLAELNTAMKEQLQSTNMNFHQVGDTLYIIGGYAFSNSQGNHITFPYLTTIRISELINGIITNEMNINKYFKQVMHEDFAVTGGHLATIRDTFILVGGHRFDGRYNPMGNPTFTQKYTNAVRRFKILNNDTIIKVTHLTPIVDEFHLHRRDYNLIPRINIDNTLGYTISSGVFQHTADLPFLYPVDINSNSIRPITSFNQYLSNYHSAVANVYSSINKTQFSIFIGGMSQYYYLNDSLIKDDNVPFTKTISVVQRKNDTLMEEFKLPLELNNFKGASAEFIKNNDIHHLHDDFADIDNINSDTITLGYVYGGISSNSLNPFVNNQTNTTSADATIFEVVLIKKKQSTGLAKIKSNPSIKSTVYPNPAENNITVSIQFPESGTIYITWLDVTGKIIKRQIANVQEGDALINMTLPEQASPGNLSLIINLNHRFVVNHQIQRVK
ncbi:MAG: hypothetical protein ACK4K9_04410 [Bacteroidia bacterium]